jgi:hypothetical protein
MSVSPEVVSLEILGMLNTVLQDPEAEVPLEPLLNSLTNAEKCIGPTFGMQARVRVCKDQQHRYFHATVVSHTGTTSAGYEHSSSATGGRLRRENML